MVLLVAEAQWLGGWSLAAAGHRFLSASQRACPYEADTVSLTGIFSFVLCSAE